jgi:hypothetical protein
MGRITTMTTKEDLQRTVDEQWEKIVALETDLRNAQTLLKSSANQVDWDRQQRAGAGGRILVLTKMLKEVVFQFEGLVRFISEDEYMDDELEGLFVALLKDARKVLGGK